ncbi:MAG: 2,3,4,5-tetrahydropyridine-2,6-dicarboxylate N-succinyltransferase [Waddliaceae bacterium]|jgi:2,3,4,5-tetrahydropyridine-2,6-dicarboxylate N-succinyltransferase|nr:2,3,4,5-tetrahydropyridine-2,6-dicarboxylate N-succinyltransferase [Waddliaceae bacterium]MBT3579335.1 2,3,4,5-tetrahydropyridine-2,6-dicarboxylate N-succinyltransferase [Waddliaceae bacterium]MBT4445466.1 2,3,4,5-tetrahydropyridine-2,6-dicarboxylate N-succinyltransferase [Waddliaceae bacterium]MBT6928864.1 2,3,4,5-tetrahydropyridine-2,6-dicarboxylate N-succinyltransferase [Waddliaceae bacterium]MBT7265207.1 2,3,4,5-tetrahydropyridine-2,6-dicarboxylate N-succinyltransferase [Waddliaceae bact
MYEDIKNIIEPAYDAETLTTEMKKAVEDTIEFLDKGKLRVCSCDDTGKWTTHQWIKKAILLYFKVRDITVINAGDITFADKIPLKQWTGDEGVRVVPHAIARYGSFLAKNTVMMPGYVNIGAYVDEGTMVDTWATVGSCAQIGKRVHLSGGVGIGGVLEPLQNTPVIIEDDAFIGSRCIVVEGAHIGKGAVLGAGTIITASTKIVDVTGNEMVISRGSVPANSVVIPGTLPKKFPAGEVGVPCALIIGSRNENTDKKISLNDALREYTVAI